MKTINNHAIRTVLAEQGSKFQNRHPYKIAIEGVEGGVASKSDIERLEEEIRLLEVDLTFKGEVETEADLPSDATIGDVYLVNENGSLYVYTGEAWRPMSEGGFDPLYIIFHETTTSTVTRAEFLEAYTAKRPIIIVTNYNYCGAIWYPTYNLSTVVPSGAFSLNVPTTAVTQYSLATGVRGPLTVIRALKMNIPAEDNGFLTIDDVYGTDFYLNEIDNLESTLVDHPLSANQGRVLNEKIEQRVKENAGAPTASTEGVIGSLLEDTTNGELYQLKSIDTSVTPNIYNWEKVGSGGTQSDYDVNDSSDPAYIKNRPFYDLSIELPEALGGGEIFSGTPYCFLSTKTGGNAFPEGSDKWNDAIVQSLMNQGYLVQADSGASLTRSFLVAVGLDPNYYGRSSLVLLFSDSVDFSVISGGSTILINAGSIDDVTWSWNEQTLTLTDAGNHFYANLTGSDRYGSTTRFELSIWPQFKVITIRQESGYIGESIRSYSFGGTLNGTLKTIEPKYLPDATSSKKGGVTLSQIGNSIATGSYLRKYESSGLTAIDLRAAPVVDWNSDNIASPQTILNKPFGSIAAGYTYPGSGTQSLYSYSPDWHVLEFEFTSTSDSYADKFGVTQALLNTAGGTLHGTGYCIVTGTDTYATSWNNFLDAVADLVDRGGAPSVAFTYRCVDMEGEPPYTGSKTFTGITNNNGIYTAQGEATYYSDFERYFITNFSFWKETVNNAEVWCYHLSFSISDPWGSVGPEVQGGGAITAVATTTAVMTQQLDASYIPLDPNVFTINAQGQITLRS